MKGSEFLAALERDERAIVSGKSPVLSCATCGTPLQESITGMRQRSDGRSDCSDCYFDAVSDAIDARPIGAGRRPRG